MAKRVLTTESGAPVASYIHVGTRTPRPIMPSVEELAAHAAFVARLREPVWMATG